MLPVRAFLPFLMLLWVLAGIAPAAGKVTVSGIKGPAVAGARSGDSLGAGTTLQTALLTSVDLVLQPSGAVVRVLPDSVVEFTEVDGPKGKVPQIRLVSGSLLAMVPASGDPSSFSVVTAGGLVTTTGGEFKLSAGGVAHVLTGNMQFSVGTASVGATAGQSLLIPTNPTAESLASVKPVETPLRIAQQAASDLADAVAGSGRLLARGFNGPKRGNQSRADIPNLKVLSE